MKKHSFVLKYFIILVIFLVSCDYFNTSFEDQEDAIFYQASDIKEIPIKDTLVIMDWNIKFAGGRIDFFFDCYGNRSVMTKEEVINNLNGLIKKIKEIDPDILIVQEIDIDSKRCAYINSVQYILDHTDLNYAYYASQWKADFVPSDGIGRINSGNAIFSKYKLYNGKRIALPEIEEQSALTRYFYLKRNILECELKYKNKYIKIIGTHLSAYAHDGTKLKQLNILKDLLLNYRNNSIAFIFAGDLNTLPPIASKWHDFPDSKCEDEEFQADDYREEKEYLVDFYKFFYPAIPLDSIKKNEAKYFTHTTDKNGFWNRTLDYIFTYPNIIVPNSAIVYQDETTGIPTMPLSDHCPTSVKVRLP